MAAQQLISPTFLAAATLAATVLAPAMADAEPTTPSTGSMLNLSVRSGLRDDDVRTASLTCDPAGGTHRNATAACQALSAVNGDFGQLGTRDSLCTQEMNPVTLVAKGTWQNRPITFEKNFPNLCMAQAATGKVFDF